MEKFCSFSCSVSVVCSASGAMSKWMVRKKVVPSPSLLVKSMVPPHALHQILGDGQAQARALVGGAGVVVLLG